VAVAPVSDSAHDVTGRVDVSSGKRTLSFRGPRPDGWKLKDAPERVLAFSPDGKPAGGGVREGDTSYTMIWQVAAGAGAPIESAPALERLFPNRL